MLALPLAFTALLAAFGALPAVRENPRFLWAFWGATAILLAWTGALWIRAARGGRTLSTRFVLRRPHWLQPLVQLSIYVYWGWYWRQVYDSAWLIAAQLVFAYAFDMLLAWSRRDEYELGFGPFPIILSMNLFLWFKPDWFYLQFVMVAVGFAAKELIRWKKDGRLAHIFNPSSFPLAIASVFLIWTGTVDHTWGREIAVSIGDPLHIFEFLFLISIPGQILFGVATLTMPAVVTTFLLSAAYSGVTGTYYFFGPIPTAAFLGMLLLFTDPSTAPKTELGRIFYGVLYGVSVFILYGLLDLAGQPTFYDKLLFVPFLNLGVRAIDRLALSPLLSRFDTAALGRSLSGRKRNLAFTCIWAIAFAGVFAAHGVGDSHPANRLPFWQHACDEKLRNGCRNLETMETTYCQRGSGWACNEFGIRAVQDASHSLENRSAVAKIVFDRSCTLGTPAGCANAGISPADAGAGAEAFRHQPPSPEDYEIVLETKGLPRDRTVLQLWQWACEQGWQDGCEKAASVSGPGGLPGGDRLRSAHQYESECAGGSLAGCRNLGLMYRRGDGVRRDDRRAMACDLGVTEGCVGPL